MEFVQQKTDTENINKNDYLHHEGSMNNLESSIKNASISVLYKKRVFWLVLLVFGNIFSGAGIAYFEEIITSYVALVFFLPLLIDSGGNAGSQSATLMVRALATGDVKPNDWGKMLGREVFVALGLGLSMAAAVYLLGLYRGGYEIAMVVGLSMIAIVLIGSLIGTILPFGLHKLNLDPASASAPMITSIADISGVLIYFAIASAVLEIG
ncbi:magnesium transporter [Aliivibrio finisterrensis]|uniref:magnesium transporter n=1 Tax=Aliivibrio finisterrensis TaxID=511998 RepID=UPI0010216D71|nr:magnesium transporter [Aliivibrio finisterrensis]RYU68067.1 magnesium transporter [Aliivibrio finisterrensis]RYU71735.1 magnesium transporter [Aliivibrio finisterrensis]RYU75410.1 magnesium transporter [Aliivibrio finisterrensis]